MTKEELKKDFINKVAKKLTQDYWNFEKGKEQGRKEAIKIIEDEIIKSPHLFSIHKGKGKFCGCIVCQVLNKILSKLKGKSK